MMFNKYLPFVAFSKLLLHQTVTAPVSRPHAARQERPRDRHRARHRRLPIAEEDRNGRTVWYILIDVFDAVEAKAKGLVFASALAGGGVILVVTFKSGTSIFATSPEFSGNRSFVPGPAGFRRRAWYRVRPPLPHTRRQNYELPGDINLSRSSSVSIWCSRFRRRNGTPEGPSKRCPPTRF